MTTTPAYPATPGDPLMREMQSFPTTRPSVSPRCTAVATPVPAPVPVPTLAQHPVLRAIRVRRSPR